MDVDAILKSAKARLKIASQKQSLLSKRDEKSFLLENEIKELANIVVIIECFCNDRTLQMNNCVNCGKPYIKKSSKHHCCSSTCRSQISRAIVKTLIK